MALQKGKLSEFPEDAVRLTESQALEYQFKLLRNWKETSDVAVFKYGIPSLGIASAATGIYLNSYFRRKYKLQAYGTISTYLPTCVIPTIMSILFHMQAVVPDVVLFKGNCPVCLEIRAASTQAFFGGILPFLLGNVGCLGIASKYVTYNVPSISQEPLKVLKLTQAMSKPILNILIAICIGHALLGSAVTYYEGKAVFTVQKKLLQFDRMEE